MLERLFKIREAGSSVRVELLGGLTTFLTMAYIIFVNPGIIATEKKEGPTSAAPATTAAAGATSSPAAGGRVNAATRPPTTTAAVHKPKPLTFHAAMLATCLAAAVATLLMGLLANYPIAQAPGMGENFFFAAVVATVAAAGVANAWQVALGIVFISGVLFLTLSIVPFRRAIIDTISPSLKNGIAVGIGLFITFIGLLNAGVIVSPPGAVVELNRNIGQPGVIIFFIGLVVTAALHARGVRGSILLGILLTAAVALVWGKTSFKGVVGLPEDSALFKMDLRGALDPRWFTFIVVFLFMDVFDTAGTLIGVGEQAGFIKDNKLPRANRAMISDAVGTLIGSVTGTSTVTSYIESATGVQYGARTGLASVATGILFLLAIFLTPLAAMIGEYKPITAPALVIVGAMMVRNVMKIDWKDYSEVIPAFLAMIGIPLTFSIADGLALGFVSYPIIKVLAGRWRQVSWMMYLVAAIFILRYALIKG